MSLSPPILDDRTFQDLVDDAKRFIRERCPEWTDHNVSDPGVTLVEAFAWMSDVLLYRLNRVPERQYLKFLELVGIELDQPTAARVLVSFRLAAHLDDTVPIAAATGVSTRRTAEEAAVHFETVRDTEIVPAVSRAVFAAPVGVEPRNIGALLGSGAAIECFGATPQPGDCLYVGLDRPAPSHLLLIQVQCVDAAGHGIDPLHPPLRWQAWDGTAFTDCEIEVDETRGLNVSGPIELHLPAQHIASEVAGQLGHWVRCVVVDPAGRKAYRSSPRIRSVTAATVGVDVEARHARAVRDEPLGHSTGVPGQSVRATHTPILVDENPFELTVDGTPWVRVPSFAESGKADEHYLVEPSSGTIRFGPAVRESGAIVQRGAVPEKDAQFCLRAYQAGGGFAGNLAPREISQLRTSIPYVARVYNRHAATGGVDGETVSEARVRGPMMLHARNRAITLDDYELLAKRAARHIARTRASVEDGGAIRVVIVPNAPQDAGRIDLRDLLPSPELLRSIQLYLDERRTVGSTAIVSPARYHAVTVVARLQARPGADVQRVRRDALAVLYRYLNPIAGGVDGSGWSFGRGVSVADLRLRLETVADVATTEVTLFEVAPGLRERTGPVDRVNLRPPELVFSHDHEVIVS